MQDNDARETRKRRRSRMRRARLAAAAAAVAALTVFPPTSPAQDGGPSVISAAQSGDLLQLQSLISSGSEVNARDSSGNTALFYAAAGGQTEMVSALLRAGADPSIVGANGWAPAQVANLAGPGHVG